MNDNVYNKKLGIGSLSLLISIFTGLVTCYNTKDGVLLLEYMVGPVLSNGIISLILWGISIYLGKKYSYHKWARAGLTVSLLFIGMFISGILLTLIITLF